MHTIELVFYRNTRYLSSEELYVERFKKKYPKIELKRAGRGTRIEGMEGKLGIGAPDFYMLVEGKPLFIEIKTPGTGLSREQMKWLKDHPGMDFKLVFVYTAAKRRISRHDPFASHLKSLVSEV